MTISDDSCSGPAASFPAEVTARVTSSSRSAVRANWLHDAPMGREILLQENGMTAGEFSREVSRLMGRPVLVVRLDDLPHHKKGGGFTDSELSERAEALREMAETEVPSEIWKQYKWTVAAESHEPTNDGLCTPEKFAGLPTQAPLSRRIPNACWKKAGVVFLPETYLTPREMWTDMIGLDDMPTRKNPNGRWNHPLERIPPGDSVRIYTRRHELVHLEQQHPNCNTELTDDRRNLAELDADIGAFSDLRWMAGLPNTSDAKRNELLETSQGIMHVRALQTFIKSTKPYCFTVAFDAHAYDAQTVSPEWEAHLSVNYGKNWLAAYELRLRVLAEMGIEGLEHLPRDSFSIRQHLVGLAAHAPVDQKIYDAMGHYLEAPYNWSGLDPADTLPILRDIVNNGEIDSPFTRRNANLVLQAVDYFKPSLLHKRAMVAEPQRPVAETTSWSFQQQGIGNSGLAIA